MNYLYVIPITGEINYESYYPLNKECFETFNVIW